jgi:uncharacterized membrane protein (UPF0127 family)
MKSKTLAIILWIIFLILLCLLYFLYKGQIAAPAPTNENSAQNKQVSTESTTPARSNYQTITISIGQNEILAEVADTEAKRELGLGNRTTLAENHGMLFIFDTPSRYGFWMKDTNFPLDFVWIDQNKKIIDITSDVSPETYPEVFYPSGEVLYVLEISGGLSKKLGIEIGERADF